LFHVEQFRVNGRALENFVVSGFVLFGMHLRKIMPKCASCSEWGFLTEGEDFSRGFCGLVWVLESDLAGNFQTSNGKCVKIGARRNRGLAL